MEPDVIEAFAVEMATTKPAAILTCSAVTRAFRGEQVAQAFFTLGWMTGNVGKPGAMVSDCSQKLFGNGGQLLCVPGPDGKPALRDPLCNSMDIYGSPMPQDGLFGIPAQGRWEAVLNDGFQNGKWGWKDLDIRMIWDIGRGNKLNPEPGTLGGIEAYRKVEFVVAADIALNTSAQYADVVLPSVAQWEYPANFSAGTNRESLTYCAQVIEPLFEGKSDTWINMELAKRLGIDPASIELPEEEVFLNQLQGAQVMKEDGTGFETMFTVTAQDWAELGDPSREPQTGRMDWQEFKRTGMFQLKREPGDNYGYIALKDFVEDPEANPVATESGKLEDLLPQACGGHRLLRVLLHRPGGPVRAPDRRLRGHLRGLRGPRSRRVPAAAHHAALPAPQLDPARQRALAQGGLPPAGLHEPHRRRGPRSCARRPGQGLQPARRVYPPPQGDRARGARLRHDL